MAVVLVAWAPSREGHEAVDNKGVRTQPPFAKLGVEMDQPELTQRFWIARGERDAGADVGW